MTTDGQTGQRFGLIAGRYQLRGQLGVGGMGRVWLAYDEMLDRDVAIKEVAPRQALSPEQSEEMAGLILREARAAARINHPHVVQIYDVIQTEDWPWIVMEYIPSLSLYKLIQHEGPLPPGEVAVIGLALLEALNAAHGAGILHRDVKPDNVLIGEDGRVVLTDFGLARQADDRATQTNRMGTPQYVAPERAQKGISSKEADFWSLGATLYAAVEGRSPYQRKTMMETLTSLATQPPDPMTRGGALEPVIMGLLRREPSERLTPQQVETALKRVLDGGSAKAAGQRARSLRRPRTTRRGLLRALPAALLALLLPSVAVGSDAGVTHPVLPGTPWEAVVTLAGLTGLLGLGAVVVWWSARGPRPRSSTAALEGATGNRLVAAIRSSLRWRPPRWGRAGNHKTTEITVEPEVTNTDKPSEKGLPELVPVMFASRAGEDVPLRRWWWTG